MARPSGRPIRDEVVEAACEMVRDVGVNAFSYGDLARRLDISAPSIHHHFRTKDDLVGEVATRYREDFAAQRDALDASTVVGIVTAYAAMFGAAASADLMCLCGSIASDWTTVGAQTRAEVSQFFDDELAWLAEQLVTGIRTGELRPDVDPQRQAAALLAALEGAILLSRAGISRSGPEVVADSVLRSIRR